MRIRPNGAELLHVARATLAERIVPFLPHDRLECVAKIEGAMASCEEQLAADVAAPAADLDALEAARLAMRDTILRALPAERRYDARLVAKAIAIAARQLAKGNADEIREAQRLADLLGAEAPAPGEAGAVRRCLAALNERLAARIRSGAADGGMATGSPTLTHLETITREALSESNPAYHRLSHACVATSPVATSPVAALRAAASPTTARLKATVAAWRGVPGTFFPEPAASWRGALPVAQYFDSWLRYGAVVGEALCVSRSAAFATQADVYGYVALRVAANPDMPMFVVEGAHQFHDFSLAVAEMSAAFFASMLAPFRIFCGASDTRTRR